MTNNSARAIGTLYVVATPIGNRDDLSLRALATLKAVDSILAEDTRHSANLLNFFGIHKPLVSLHAHNEAEKCEPIINALLQGRSFALVSDAGTPLISDPGFPLVRLARAHGIPVIPIPGACALIAALSAAGVACDTFTFVGFLPAKPLARRAKLAGLRQSEHTIVFYESTHRIQDCIKDLITIYGNDYELVLVKELTKTFECFRKGTAEEINHWLQADSAHSKGEFVVILPGCFPKEEISREKEVLSLLLDELPLKQAVKIASLLTNSNKNALYKLALAIKA